MNYLPLIALLLVSGVHAYSPDELRVDCAATDDLLSNPDAPPPPRTLNSARCQAYVEGIADGYAVGDRLAERVGVRLGAFCPPVGSDRSMRLVRSVRLHLERLPPNAAAATATLVAGALARSFPCTEALESKP